MEAHESQNGILPYFNTSAAYCFTYAEAEDDRIHINHA